MARHTLSLLRLGTACLLLALFAVPVLGQGRIIIEPPPPTHPPQPRPPRRPPPPTREVPLRLKYLNVNTEIIDGVAVTTVKQTFHNQSGGPIEGTYVFPLPDDAAVGSFNMTVNGQKMTGEVLDAQAARRTYEEIVRRTRDPGLLEYLGGRMYRASLFPIPPGGVAEVELQYTQTLRESDGLGLFQHPLRGATTVYDPIEQLVFHVKLRSQSPLSSVFCPTHTCEIVRPNDREATVTCELSNVRPESDFQLYYQRSDKLIGLTLLTHRAPGEPGYFLLRAAPRIETRPDQIQPKDIAFVVDTSGSMRAGKIDQAKAALKFCISTLNDRDRFNIYAFSTEIHPFRDGLVPADADMRAAATEFAGKLEALGGTNINQALLAALAADPGDEARPYLIVFMTDGQPTVDVTDPEQILKNAGAKNARQVRFHVLGVGTDVNTHLLDKLAEMNRGSREYCLENENLEIKLSGLAGRLANPVLTEIALRIDGLKTDDLYPQALPDLFRGGELVVLGRYDGSGQHAIELKGRMLNDTQTVVSEADFPEKSRANDFLPRLWAQRKIAYLLDQIRLHGQNKELIDEVVRLAKRFGVVTPYTAALIVEDERLWGSETSAAGTTYGVRARNDVVGRAARKLAGGGGGARGGGVIVGGGGRAASPAPARHSGEAAVDASREILRAKEATAPATEPAELDGEKLLRQLGDKTFAFDGNRWIDTAWDSKQEPQKVVAFSDDYFKLLEQHEDLARYFALGERVLVVFGDQVYETQPEPETQPASDGGD